MRYPRYERYKDSGVEWIGEVPEGWEIYPLSIISNKVSNGYVGPTRDILVDEGVKYLQSLHIKNGKIDFEKSPYFVQEKWSRTHQNSIIKYGDVLVVQTGDIGGEGTIGKTGILGVESTTNQAICSILPNEKLFISKYLLRILNYLRPYWMVFAMGTRRDPNISQEIVANMVIPLPSLEKQKTILDYIETRIKDIDFLITAIQNQIDKLQEYRQSLISEAVTGKINCLVKD